MHTGDGTGGESADLKPEGGNGKAILLIHGWATKKGNGWVGGFPGPFIELLRETLPGVTLIHPDLQLGIFSPARPEALVDHLIAEVDAHFRCSPFKELIVVAFSAGSLLARALLATARGAVDMPDGEPDPARAKPWANRISRLVLLAGITRGWEISSATPAPIRFMAPWVLALLNRWSRLRHRGAPTFIEQLKRGAPFVVETRLKLLQVELSAAANTGPPLPHTVLLLGSKDEYVSPADAMDLGPRADCSYIEVPDSTHMSLLEVHGELDTSPRGSLQESDDIESGPRRADFIRRALTEPPARLAEIAMHTDDIDDYSDPMDRPIQTCTGTSGAGPAAQVDLVVFIIHGIRDNGFWTKRVAREVKAIGRTRALVIRAPSPSYGYFSMWDFINPWGRRDATWWFLGRYAEVKRLWPRVPVCFIGHSNGTFIAAHALEQCQLVKFERIAFAGSVVRTGFPWSTIGDRVKVVLNVVATRDMVVASLPGAFERLRLKFLGVGGAGVEGFTDLPAPGEGPHVENFRFIAGGHGAGVDEPMWGDLSRFVVCGHLPAQPDGDPQRPRRRTHKEDRKLKRAVWVPVLGLLILLFVFALLLITAGTGGLALVTFTGLLVLLIGKIMREW